MKRNTLKDFVHVAGPLGVSHFCHGMRVQSECVSDFLFIAKSELQIYFVTLTNQIAPHPGSTDINRK